MLRCEPGTLGEWGKILNWAVWDICQYFLQYFLDSNGSRKHVAIALYFDSTNGGFFGVLGASITFTLERRQRFNKRQIITWEMF